MEYFETKTTKYIFFGVLAIVPTFIFVVFIVNVTWGPSSRQTMRRNDSLESVNGVVDTIFNDAANHDIRTAILTNKAVYQISELWANDIHVGDSLSKNKGSFFLEVYRKSKKVNILDYKKLIPSE